MFGLSKFFERRTSIANDHGFNAAMLGLDKINPYPIGSIDHKQWEWGWNEGIDTLQEAVDAHNISDEYESGS